MIARTDRHAEAGQRDGSETRAEESVPRDGTKKNDMNDAAARKARAAG